MASRVTKSFSISHLPYFLKTPPWGVRYGAALVLAILAQFVRLPLHPPTLMSHITYVPFILLAAALGGLGPGLVCTVLSTLENIWFAIEPVGSFHVADPQQWLGIAALALTGAVASVLFDRLRSAEKLQRDAFTELTIVQDSAPVMMLIVDEALHVRKANPLALKFSALGPEDVLGFGPGTALGCLNSLQNPEGCGRGPNCADCAVRLAVQDTFRTGNSHSGVETWMPLRADGEEQLRCLQMATVPMHLNEIGTMVLVCALDITERKQAEAALLEQRDALQHQAELINLSHDAVVTLDQNRVIIGWNTGAEEMYGWTEAEARGRVIPDFLKTRPTVSVADIDQFLVQSGRWDGELEQARRDGTLIIVESRQVLMRDSAGNPTGILEINRDITSQKQAAEQLRQAHQRTTGILESISDGFFAFDREWRHTYVNPAAARIVGIAAEDLLGKTLWEMWPRAIGTQFEAAIRRAMAENVPVHIEEFYPAPLNAWFEVTYYPSPEGLTQFFTNITERKKAEAEIHRLNAELEQRVRDRTAQLEAANQELETFAYSVSHDLRAPLRGVDGWSLALLEDFGPKLDDEARHYLGRIRSEAQRMGELIDALLRLSRVTRVPLERKPVDLTAVAHSIAGDLQESHKDRRLDFAIEPGLAVTGDAGLLEVAMINLLSNAAKFTAKQPVARIEVGRIELDGLPAIYIRDNGAGFDMAYSKSLFGPFQRLHRSSEFPGTGIGLATVKRIIRRHGGRVWADAKVNAGATFYFTLE